MKGGGWCWARWVPWPQSRSPSRAGVSLRPLLLRQPQQLHSDSSTGRLDVEYLLIQGVYIPYKYFHLAAVEHRLSQWDTRKLFNMNPTASPLTLCFTVSQSFCENFWLRIIHIVHCFLHNVVLDLSAPRGTRRRPSAGDGSWHRAARPARRRDDGCASAHRPAPLYTSSEQPGQAATEPAPLRAQAGHTRTETQPRSPAPQHRRPQWHKLQRWHKLQ